MLIFEGPDQRSSWGFHAVEGYSIWPAEENYRSYSRLLMSTGAVQISDTVVFPPPQRFNFDLPATPTTEEVVQESERELGESLKQPATNNPVYTHLTTFSNLQQISDMVNSATKKAADAMSEIYWRPEKVVRCVYTGLLVASCLRLFPSALADSCTTSSGVGGAGRS